MQQESIKLAEQLRCVTKHFRRTRIDIDSALVNYIEQIKRIRRSVAELKLHRIGERSPSRKRVEHLSRRRCIGFGVTALTAEETWEAALACRFGFEQALVRWRDNPDARAGLQGVIALLVTRAIALRDVAGARSLLAELQAPDARLADELAALEGDVSLTRERVSRARVVQREMDFSVWQTARPWVFGALVGADMALAVWISARRPAGVDPSPYEPLIGADAVVALIASAVLFAVRRRAMANLIGRRMNAVIVLGIASGIVVDVFAWRLGWPVPYSSAYRFVALAVVCFFAALLGLPALGYVGVSALVGASLAAAFPAYVYTIVPIGLTLFTLQVWGLVRAGRLNVAEADSIR